MTGKVTKFCQVRRAEIPLIDDFEGEMGVNREAAER